ncbi:MAG: IPTL-CTERM sorting domain-containing protein [Acidobacteria bacterium]|nr:IPTL-CTERM sorting domain-containing protein [Acidobacteriota bacterium]
MTASNGRTATIPILVVLLALFGVLPAWAGMAELGHSGGETAKGKGKVTLKVNPNFNQDYDENDVNIDTVTEILALLADQINSHPSQGFRATHTADTNVIEVMKGNQDPDDLEFTNEGSFAEAVGNDGFDRLKVVIQSGNGGIFLPDQSLGSGTVTITANAISVPISTVGKSAAQLLDAFAAAFDTNGFAVSVDGSELTIFGANSLTWEHTGTDIKDFGVLISFPGSTIPTLSQWGMILLVLLILASALWSLQRRRLRGQEIH